MKKTSRKIILLFGDPRLIYYEYEPNDVKIFDYYGSEASSTLKKKIEKYSLRTNAHIMEVIITKADGSSQDIYNFKNLTKSIDLINDTKHENHDYDWLVDLSDNKKRIYRDSNPVQCPELTWWTLDNELYFGFDAPNIHVTDCRFTALTKDDMQMIKKHVPEWYNKIISIAKNEITTHNNAIEGFKNKLKEYKTK